MIFLANGCNWLTITGRVLFILLVRFTKKHKCSLVTSFLIFASQTDHPSTPLHGALFNRSIWLLLYYFYCHQYYLLYYFCQYFHSYLFYFYGCQNYIQTSSCPTHQIILTYFPILSLLPFHSMSSASFTSLFPPPGLFTASSLFPICSAQIFFFHWLQGKEISLSLSLPNHFSSFSVFVSVFYFTFSMFMFQVNCVDWFNAKAYKDKDWLTE